MGRAIILVFFVIGFVIFAVIKYASTGVKAAYKVVNDPDAFKAQDLAGRLTQRDRAQTSSSTQQIGGKDPVVRACQIASSGLSPQKVVAAQSGDVQDNFSLGYVLGFSRSVAYVQCPLFEKDVVRNVFDQEFTGDISTILYFRALDLRENLDKDGLGDLFHDGYFLGIHEGKEYALSRSESHSTLPPLGWLDYLLTKSKGSREQ